MSWIEPKTDWTSSDYFNAEDYNRIIGNVIYLKAFSDALFNSLEVTGVKRAGNCVTTEIYFSTPSYDHGWVPLQSGGYGYSYWTDDYILDVTMTGKLPHGGYEGGTAIWTESMAKLGGGQGIKNLLIQELKKQGV